MQRCFVMYTKQLNSSILLFMFFISTSSHANVWNRVFYCVSCAKINMHKFLSIYRLHDINLNYVAVNFFFVQKIFWYQYERLLGISIISWPYPRFWVVMMMFQSYKFDFECQKTHLLKSEVVEVKDDH